jgi:protein ImuB
MRLWIGIHLPLLSLEHFAPNLSGDSISVVLEQERVLAMSRAARAAGIKPNMRRGGVLMLEPDAQIMIGAQKARSGRCRRWPLRCSNTRR